MKNLLTLAGCSGSPSSSSSSRRCCRCGSSGYLLGILTVAYYFGVFSMAWDLLFGFAGEVNFGPTFLIGLGAYTAAILDNQLRPADLRLRHRRRRVAAVVGGIAAGGAGAAARGPYFGLVTLVAVLLLQNVIVIFAGTDRRRDRHDRARRALDRRRRRTTGTRSASWSCAPSCCSACRARRSG